LENWLFGVIKTEENFKIPLDWVILNISVLTMNHKPYSKKVEV